MTRYAIPHPFNTAGVPRIAGINTFPVPVPPNQLVHAGIANQQQQIVQAINAANANRIAHVNTAYPGQNMNLSRQQIEDIAAQQGRVYGTSFTSAAGTTSPPVVVPPTSKYLFGIAFSGTPANTDTFTIMINEMQLTVGASVDAYTVAAGKPDRGYFPLFSLLAGQNSINLTYTSVAGGQPIVFNYLFV